MFSLLLYIGLGIFSGSLGAMESNSYECNKLLHEGIAQLNYNQVHYALQHGADVESEDHYMNAALHQLVFRAERCNKESQEQKVIPIMALLLDHNAMIDRHDVRGRSPLHIATFFDAKPVMAFLQERGALQHFRDAEGRTLFDVSVHGWRCRELLEADFVKSQELLRKGATPDSARNKYGFPLHNALLQLDIAKAKLLLTHHANPDSEGLNGKRPLHYLIDVADRLRNDEQFLVTLDLAALLLQHDADVNAQDGDGNAPLHYAATKKIDAWVVFLVLHKAELGVQNNKGFTPLHCLLLNRLYTNHKKKFLRSLLLLSARNYITALPEEDFVVDDRVLQYIAYLEALLSIEDDTQQKVMDYTHSRAISELFNPALVQDHFYEDATSCCRSLKPYAIDDMRDGYQQAQGRHQRSKSLE